MLKSISTILVDMDGTLVNTDKANNLAYIQAVAEVTGETLRYTDDKKSPSRITFTTIKQMLPNLEESKYCMIKELKDKNYNRYLDYTYINEKILDFIHKNSDKKFVLVSNSHIMRVVETLKHHSLLNLFSYFFYTNGNCNYNKYHDAFSKLKINPHNVLVFENEKQEIENAINENIPKENIVQVKQNTKYFKIYPNEFLSEETSAYYHTEYTKFGDPNNPNYINTLKNIFCNKTKFALDCASKELESALNSDLPIIYEAMTSRLKGDNEIVICSIPRSKTTFGPVQKYFRQTLSNVVDSMPIFTNGVNYIERVVDTRTTHMKKETAGFENCGKAPYKGITLETCDISCNVAGKHILLVDDVYTKTINIAEDAIEALYVRGAKSVTFYAIARTVHYSY